MPARRPGLASAVLPSLPSAAQFMGGTWRKSRAGGWWLVGGKGKVQAGQPLCLVPGPGAPA